MRWVPFVAWIICFVSLILSLVTLLAGAAGNSLESAAIITFDTSYLGLGDYHDPISDLGKNITALVPPDVTNPASITQYVGVKDWYSMHYLSVCEGFWEPDPSGAGLTSTKVNITCSRQSSGYSFSLVTHVQNELKASIQELAGEVTAKSSYATGPWVGCLYGGIVLTIVEVLLLPFTFNGTRRINMYCFIIAGFAYICLVISSGLATGHMVGVKRYGYGLYSETFVGLTWASAVCMVLVYILAQFEWRFQVWTPKGQRITTYKKPAEASWFLMKDLRRKEAIRIDD